MRFWLLLSLVFVPALYGGLIVYVLTNDGRPEIWSMQTDGDQKINLYTVTRGNEDYVTSDGAKWPRIAPDGRRIAFYNYRGSNQNLVVMNLDGSQKRELTSEGYNSDPSWSPDATELVYRRVVNKRAGLWIIPVDGGEPRELVNNPEMDRGPHWSPEGDWIAFSNGFGAARDGGEEIYIIRPDGTGQKRLTQSKGEDSLPRFSPDGKQLAFNSKRTGQTDIFIHHMETDGIRALTRFGDAYMPAWSPDGRYLLFNRVDDGAYNLYIVPVAGGEARSITNGPIKETVGNWVIPSTARDCIAYQSGAAGNDDIWIMDADGRFPYQLTRSRANDRRPSWSPDGSTIYFESDRDGIWGVYARKISEGSARRVTPPEIMEKYPSLSADGTTLAAIGFEQNRGSIHLSDRDGKNRQIIERPLDANGSYDRYPVVSPDGKQICFDSDRHGTTEYRGGENRGLEIYVADRDGGNVKRLTTNDREDALPRWSPDGRNLIYCAAGSDGYQIRMINLETSENRALTSGAKDNWSPAWSPDGESFLFISSRDGNAEIYRGFMNGSPPQRLTRTQASEGSPALRQPEK